VITVVDPLHEFGNLTTFEDGTSYAAGGIAIYRRDYEV
jgi:hypothetical protein